MFLLFCKAAALEAVNLPVEQESLQKGGGGEEERRRMRMGGFGLLVFTHLHWHVRCCIYIVKKLRHPTLLRTKGCLV